MACLVVHEVFFYVVVYAGILGMLQTASQYYLYLCSYLTSKLINVLVASYFYSHVVAMQLL